MRKGGRKKQSLIRLDEQTERYLNPNTIIKSTKLANSFANFVKERKETGIDYSKDLMLHEIDRWPLR